MRELEYQKEVVDAVRQNGGAAWKLSSKFLVGVVDLYVQLPPDPNPAWGVPLPRSAMLIEAKWCVRPKTPSTQIKLEVTPKQLKMLRDNHNAGGVSGVASFVNGKGREWGIGLFTLDQLGKDMIVSQDQHDWSVTQATSRRAFIFHHLVRFYGRTNG